jgi:hypothetical protein
MDKAFSDNFFKEEKLRPKYSLEIKNHYILLQYFIAIFYFESN